MTDQELAEKARPLTDSIGRGTRDGRDETQDPEEAAASERGSARVSVVFGMILVLTLAAFMGVYLAAWLQAASAGIGR